MEHHEHHHTNQDHGRHDFNKHEGHHAGDFLKKFYVTLVLTIPILLYSELFMAAFHWNAPRFPVVDAIILVLGSIIYFYGGSVFLVGAYRELRARLPGMMTLIAIAITAAYGFSVYTTFAGGMNLFWELATLIAIMLIGHWVEMRAVSGAQGALKELSKLLPDTAEVIRNGQSEKITLVELRQGDQVLVRPGGKIPADGIIVDGDSDVNESMITGESKPVSKVVNDAVIAGTINGDGALTIRVTEIGDKTFLSGVMRLVAEAQDSKSRMQILSDRAAFFLTIVAVLSGVVTLVAWLAVGSGFEFAITRLVAVLVVACPHALGLAVPLVASISTTKAAQNGFLIKQRLALEAARKVSVVLFDKTGTLTTGSFGVTNVWSVATSTREEVLMLAAAVDSLSEHPIAKAVVAEAQKRNVSLPQATKFEALKGRGVRAWLNEQEILVGGPILVQSSELEIPQELALPVKDAGNKGQTVIFVVKNKTVIGALALADIVRKESQEAVAELKKLGVKTSMITGDSEDVAAWVSKDLGIDEYFARVLPDQKSEKVKELQARGLRVAMVGDGINDAPALAQADLGVAIGAGTNVAIESAGIILVRDDPRDIVKIIKLSRMTYAKMIQNLFWASGYNIVAIPLAAGILASKGFLMDPAVSAIFMSLSTVIVSINAAILRWRKL